MNYLMIGPAWVGDMVMAQSLFKAIKKNHAKISESATIDVLAPAALCPLISRMPEVHHSIPVSLPHNELHFKYRLDQARHLKNKYDQCIVLTNSWKSALIPWLAKIPKRTGWLGEMRFGLLNDIRTYNDLEFPRMVDRFVMLAYPKKTPLSAFISDIEAPKLENDPASIQKTVNKFSLSSSLTKKPILALCPGAEFGSSKRWPEEYYAELAKLKMAEGGSVWILGSKKDRIVSEKITALLSSLTHESNSQCIDFTGKTTLDEAIDLLSLTTAVVSNDSGLMHIAAALDKPLVAVYGSTDPSFTPPLHAKADIVRLENLDCSPCFKRECPLKMESYHRCMRDLTPSIVFERLKRLMA